MLVDFPGPTMFDGNGTADTLRAYQLGSDWRLRVELEHAAALILRARQPLDLHGQIDHLPHLVGSGLPLEAFFAHDPGAHRRVTDERRSIDAKRIEQTGNPVRDRLDGTGKQL